MSQNTTTELILAGAELTEQEKLDIIEAVGKGNCLVLCDDRSLTDDQKWQLRQEAAAKIAQIEVLRVQWADFRGEKIPLAYLYAGLLTGDPKINNLDFAVKTLTAMLKDPRIPQQYRGVPDDQEPRAIRLAIASAMVAKDREFQRNLKLVEGLVEDFYTARDKGYSREMRKIFNRLAAPYFKGPLAKHYDCKLANLKRVFNRLREDLEAIEKACE